MRKSRLYILLSVACLTGYIWLVIIYTGIFTADHGVCLFRHLTTLPCPSCGSTRSVMSLVQGNFHAALIWNPIGILMTLLLALIPVWIISDLVLRKSTLFRFFTEVEIFFRRKWAALTGIILILLNWIWNIHKGV